MGSIFVDTSAWISVMDKSEERHRIAREFYLKLVDTGVKLVTSNYVLSETYTRIRYDAGHSLAVLFHDVIVSASRSGFIEIIWITPKIAERAWEIFEKYRDQIFSFTDCTSFAIVKEQRIREVFAFDDDFRIWALYSILPRIGTHNTLKTP